jgi:hypothetical protein
MSEAGWAADNHIFPKKRSRIFFRQGLDGRISIESPHEFRFFAQAILGRDQGLAAASRESDFGWTDAPELGTCT